MLFTLTPALSLKGEGAWASFDKLRTNDLLVYLPLLALKGEGAWASFDKLRTNDLLGLPTPPAPSKERGLGCPSTSSGRTIYWFTYPASSLEGEGAWVSFDKLRTNDLLVYLPRQLPRRRGGLGVLRQAQDERFTGLPTPSAPSKERVGVRVERKHKQVRVPWSRST